MKDELPISKLKRRSLDERFRAHPKSYERLQAIADMMEASIAAGWLLRCRAVGGMSAMGAAGAVVIPAERRCWPTRSPATFGGCGRCSGIRAEWCVR